MKPGRLESLLWEDRDGALAAADKELLGRYIDGHPEAKDLKKEIEILAERLDALDVAVPPADLRPRIEQALAGLPTHRGNPKGTQTPVVSQPWKRPVTSWLPLAASLLVGVAVGYLMQPGSGVSVEPAKATGSMNSIAREPNSETLRIALGQPSSSVEISRTGDLVGIRIDLENDAELEVDVEVSNGFLLVTGINADDPTGFDVTSAEGRTVLRTRGPASQVFEITATAGAVPVRLVVRENGVVVADDWLTGGTRVDRS